MNNELKTSNKMKESCCCHSGLDPESSDFKATSLDTGGSLPRTPIQGRYDRILFVRDSKYSLLIVYCLLFIFISAWSYSCKKEEAPAERRQGQALNPYTSESVFEETMKKVEAHPDDADAWFHLGDLYERNGQYAEAINAYKRVVKLRPAQGYAYFKIGTAYDRLGQSGEAVAALKKALKLMPGFAVAYNNLGIAYGKLGRNREEIAVLKKALQLRPRYTAARYNLGIAYLRVKDTSAAQRQYKILSDYDSGAAEALMKEIKRELK